MLLFYDRVAWVSMDGFICLKEILGKEWDVVCQSRCAQKASV